jgi:hypothetical protein
MREEQEPIDRLFRAPAFPSKKRQRALFWPALRRCAEIQCRRFPVLKRLYARENFSPRLLGGEGNLKDLPFLFVSVFKELDLEPARPIETALELTSSGTSGRTSRIRLDAPSLRRVVSGAESVYGALGMVDKTLKTNYLCMTYDPRKAKNLGTAFTDELLTSFTDKGEVYYALQWDAKRRDFWFNKEGALEALRRMARTGLPLRVLGFPAHVYFAYQAWREKGWPDLHLGRSSWVMTGGGWKNHSGEMIPKARFKAEVSRWLGLPASNIRDLYGLVEHGVPYVECRLGRMHVPNYARVLVRDPETLRVLPRGRGLLQLVTPYLTSTPSFCLLAGDWGELKARCRCGAPGSVLVLHGRAGQSAARGCAATAADYLGKA